MNMKNKMSMREFARAIGVPPGTVSKALNPHPEYRISPQKSAHIQAKAKEYGFSLPAERTSGRKKKKIRIGLVSGSAVSFLGGFLWEGARKYCLSEGVELLLDSSGYSPRKENTVLRQMAGEPVDALIYWPTGRDAKHRRSKRINSRADSVSTARPLIHIGDEPAQDCAYTFRFRDDEAAVETARRHLALGCRNFVILRFDYAWASDRSAAARYRGTLLAGGVPEKNIRDICIFADSDEKVMAAFRNADAVWSEHGFMLYTHLEWIARYADIRRLHVGGLGFLEFASTFQNLFAPTLRALGRKDTLSELYASSSVKFYSLRQIGAMAAKKAVEFARNPGKKRGGSEKIPWLTEDEFEAASREFRIFSLKK